MANYAIVFVHGRGPKPPKEVYRNTWLAALQQRLAPELQAGFAERCSMGYYADVLYSPTSVAGGAQKDAQSSVLSTLLDRFSPDLVVDQASPAVSGRSSREPTASLFLEDVLKYFAWDYNGVIARPVIEALDAAGENGAKVMVISHSLGTMVMYDILSDHPYGIDTWVTLGSPLGWTQDVWSRTPQHLTSFLSNLPGVASVLDRSVFSLLTKRQENPAAPEAGPSTRMEFPVPTVAYPQSATVERWYNVNDPRDPVAMLDAYLSDDFPMPDGSLRAIDVRVDNPDKRPGDRMSAHSDPGYLRTWQVGQLVSDFLLRTR